MGKFLGYPDLIFYIEIVCLCLLITDFIEIVCLCFQSLRDSLLDHGGKLNSESPPAIVTQVCIISHVVTTFCSANDLINC